jgi:hypothetical protein
MPQGPSLIFDKSSLESLNIHEAALMDNFYMSTITPLFFVECLADLEKQMRSGSTPEQLVGSLADRTPDSQGYPNVLHMAILNGELTRQFDLKTVYERVAMAHGEPVQLGEKKGVVYRKSKEQEALERWTRREFLEVERSMAKAWRKSLTAVDFNTMVKNVMGSLGPWRKPRTLEDAKQIADTIIDYVDPEWLLRFGLDLLALPDTIGVPNAADIVVADWVQRRPASLARARPLFHLHARDQLLLLPCAADAVAEERQSKPPGRSCVSLLFTLLLGVHFEGQFSRRHRTAIYEFSPDLRQRQRFQGRPQGAGCLLLGVTR